MYVCVGVGSGEMCVDVGGWRSVEVKDMYVWV